MGFALIVFYFVMYYLTPTTLFGSLGAYHLELILAGLVLLISIPALLKSFVLKIPQSLALIGLAIAVLLSVLVGEGWPGGALQEFLQFIPNALAFYLVCLHCNSKKKIQVLVFIMLFVCLFVIANGCISFLQGVPTAPVHDMNSLEIVPLPSQATHIPYLLGMRSDAGELFYRLRGLGEINDPNDFGQLIVCVIPLQFIFWRPKKGLQNFIFVLLPVCILLFGAYLTHSRGALVTLIAVAVLAARRRIGTVPALMLAGGMFVAAMALNFTGGRDISASSGSGRTALWGESMELLKSHPFFGVGFGNLPDYLGHTAHNSIAVCAAELGSFGLYFWSLFLFPTVRNLLVVSSPAKVTEGEPISPDAGLYMQSIKKIEVLDKAEINRLARLLILSIAGFLIAGWFLSRAFVMTLFLLGGMAEVVYEMALQRGMIAPRLRLERVLLYSGVLAFSLILFLYIMLRTVNLTH